jgi:hypothetical protein
MRPVRPGATHARRGRASLGDRFSRGCLLLGFGLSVGLTPGLGAAAQTPGPDAPPDVRSIPGDAYRDPEVRELLERARLSRADVAEGLDNYEARMWERAYVGISGTGFRRERGLFDMERVSRIRWTREGEHVIRWEGARRALPVVGFDSAENEVGGADLVRELAGSESRDPTIPPPLTYDPGSDRIAFGGDWALNPLADTAAYHYHFESGDTLRLTLPDADRTLLIGEVRVEPRRTEFRLVSASLWFDLESGALVRAGYRPARPFDLELDGSDGDGSPPGFLSPILAEIRYVTVDHGLYDLRWWIPRRFTFEGEARVANLVRSPFSVEWTLDEIRVNEPGTLMPDPLLPGWTLREAEVEREGIPIRLTVLVPPANELGSSPELSRAPRGEGGAFSEEELRELEQTLEQLSPGGGPPGIRLAWGLQESLTRYNRIEGLSTGAAASVSLPSSYTWRAELRLGVADREPRGELSVRSGSEQRGFSIAVYRRLDSSSEWARPHGFSPSVSTLVLGEEYTPFHRSWGAEGVVRRGGRPISGALRVFAERQTSAERGTHAHLRRLWTDRLLPENPAADVGWWAGSDLTMRWEAGMDPRGLRSFGTLRAEGGAGTSTYLRGWTSAGATRPLGRRLAAAVEAGVGGTAGELPLQRRFYPGGPAAFRGTGPGEVVGEAFWFARAELSVARPSARFVLFMDALQIGPRAEFGRTDPLLAAGAGASFLDGLLRLDVARKLDGDRGWKVFFYLDGLF